MTIASCCADQHSTIAIPIFHINSVPIKEQRSNCSITSSTASICVSDGVSPGHND